MGNQACCAHLLVEYAPVKVNGLSIGEWTCVDCRRRFYPAWPPADSRSVNKASEQSAEIGTQNCEENAPANAVPMVVTGSVGFAIERDALKAERDRLARELEEVREKVALGEDALERALSHGHEQSRIIDDLNVEFAVVGGSS